MDSFLPKLNLCSWLPSRPTALFSAGATQRPKQSCYMTSTANTQPSYSANNDESVAGDSMGHEKLQERPLASSQGADHDSFVRTWARQTWTNNHEKIINSPYHHLTSSPGKDFRNTLLKACNFWVHVEPAVVDVISNSISMLHNASLLIDDIQDGSSLRRGAPSAHKIFGVAQTINSANYVYFQAQQELSKLPVRVRHVAQNIFIEEVVNLHRGQGLDLFWRESFTIPTEAEYLGMVANKTGGLFRLGVRLLMSCGNSIDNRIPNLVPLADTLGLIFQIQDDYRNLACEEMAAKKGYADDLTEGKLSFPVIHALRVPHQPAGGRAKLERILLSHTTDNIVKAQAVEYMRETTRSFEYTRLRLLALESRAQELILELGGENMDMLRILKKLDV